MSLPASAKQKQAGGVRGGLLLLGLLLVLGSGGAFWYLVRQFDVREEYLVAARTLERRQVAGAGDFVVVEANIGVAEGVPPQFLDLVVGRWATGRIPAGTIITAGMFEEPPLSNDEEADKVLIEVNLPVGEAPGGSLKGGDKVALFGADPVDPEFGSSQVELIGVLQVDLVEGDKLSYVVTPAEAEAIQTVVDRFEAASRRRIWKLGIDLFTENLVDPAGTGGGSS